MLKWCVQLGVIPRFDIENTRLFKNYWILCKICYHYRINNHVTNKGRHKLIVALMLLIFGIHSNYTGVHTIIRIIVESFIENNGRFASFFHRRGTNAQDSYGVNDRGEPTVGYKSTG